MVTVSTADGAISKLAVGLGCLRIYLTLLTGFRTKTRLHFASS